MNVHQSPVPIYIGEQARSKDKSKLTGTICKKRGETGAVVVISKAPFFFPFAGNEMRD